MNRAAWLIIGIVLLAGCAQYSKVDAGRVPIQNKLSVQSSTSWNRLNTGLGGGSVDIWTADGLPLDSITFVTGVASGQPILKPNTSQGGTSEPYPVFDSEMSPSEIMELVEATLAKSAQTSLFETRNLRPMQFGGVEGFRFDINYVRRSDEVDREGFVAGAVRDKQLYLIIFSGTRLYHARQLAPQAEEIVRSVQFL